MLRPKPGHALVCSGGPAPLFRYGHFGRWRWAWLCRGRPPGGSAALLLSWPDCEGRGTFAARCLRRFRGDFVVFVGERPGHCMPRDQDAAAPRGMRRSHGASASRAFFSLLQRRFRLRRAVPLPSWPHAFFDDLTIWQRRDAALERARHVSHRKRQRCGM